MSVNDELCTNREWTFSEYDYKKDAEEEEEDKEEAEPRARDGQRWTRGVALLQAQERTLGAKGVRTCPRSTTRARSTLRQNMPSTIPHFRQSACDLRPSIQLRSSLPTAASRKRATPSANIRTRHRSGHLAGHCVFAVGH